MPNDFSRFAIVGAGGVGASVADELLKKNLKVTILTRDDTKANLLAFQDRGAVLTKVSYDDQASIEKALAGIEVVVSTISPYSLDLQLNVVHAAKAVGVRLFVPVEYGIFVTEGPNVTKKIVQDELKKYARPILGYDLERGTFSVIGDGKTKFSLVKSSEVGQFVAHVVSTADKSDLFWAKIPFDGERLSPLEIVELAEKKLGKKLQVTFIDYEENKKKFDTEYPAYLTTLFADGKGVPGTDEELAKAKAKYFPEWSPSPFESYIA